MNFIKKYFLSFALIVLCGIWAYSYFIVNAPCARPIEYSLGKFDNKFGISENEYLGYIKDAEDIWESSPTMSTARKNLFEYNPKGDLKINLIYDTRQQMADQHKVLKLEIDDTLQSADMIKFKMSALHSRHDTAKVEYASQLNQFNQKKSEYESQVNYWNQRGGAPKGEYGTLNQLKDVLMSQQNSLEIKRKEVNDMANSINSSVKNYNSLVKDVNSTVGVINKTAGKEFEEGEYVSDASGQRINIYEFPNKTALVHVLAHELGHALGIDHNDNPQSIMYYLNKGEGEDLSVEDMRDLKVVCRI